MWAASARADVVLRSGAGAAPGDLQGIITIFQSDLGGTDNGEGGAFSSGYRAVDWDGVPDALATPGMLPPDYYNSTSLRGLLLSSAPGDQFEVSASPGSGLPLNFGNVDSSYATTFRPFSSDRLFAPHGTVITDVHFFVPGDPSQPANISGFGAVFSDVDQMGETSIELFNDAGESLFTGYVPASPNGGYSFLGASLTDAQVSWVRITSGNTALGAGVLDGGAADLVAIDNLYYGEPLAVPEPGVFALSGLGLLLWLGFRRRS